MKRKFFFLNIYLVSRVSRSNFAYTKSTETEAQGRKLQMSLKPKKYLYDTVRCAGRFRFIGSSHPDSLHQVSTPGNPPA